MPDNIIGPCAHCGWQPLGDTLEGVLFPTGWHAVLLDVGEPQEALHLQKVPGHPSMAQWGIVCREDRGGCGVLVKGLGRDGAMVAWDRRPTAPSEEQLMELAREHCVDFRWPSSALTIMRAAIAAAGVRPDPQPPQKLARVGDSVQCDVRHPHPRTITMKLETPQAAAHANTLLMDEASGWRMAPATDVLTGKGAPVQRPAGALRYTDAPKPLQDALIAYHARPCDEEAGAIVRAVLDAYAAGVPAAPSKADILRIIAEAEKDALAAGKPALTHMLDGAVVLGDFHEALERTARALLRAAYGVPTGCRRPHCDCENLCTEPARPGELDGAGEVPRG